MKRAPRDPDPAKRWMAFIRNHREAIASMDFFTVPTVTFGVLYCFFVISHDRRRILHCNVTRHPTSLWIVQQLREAFPFDSAPRFLIFDRDAKYGLEVPAAVRSLKMNPVRTSFESPWQNGIAERWVGSCRRDLLDQVIALNMSFTSSDFEAFRTQSGGVMARPERDTESIGIERDRWEENFQRCGSDLSAQRI